MLLPAAHSVAAWFSFLTIYSVVCRVRFMCYQCFSPRRLATRSKRQRRVARVGALRFRVNAESAFLAATTGKLPPLVHLSALLRATDAIHSETETAEDLRFLLGAGSPLGGARPKSAASLEDGRLAMAEFPKPDDTRDIAAGEVRALTLAA